MKSICDFDIGDLVEIFSVDLIKYQKDRMLSMGFTKGSLIKVIRFGPKKNLTVFEVSGAMVALRREESKYIYGKKF